VHIFAVAGEIVTYVTGTTNSNHLYKAKFYPCGSPSLQIKKHDFRLFFLTKLFTGTVPANKNFVTGTVPGNKSDVTGTVKKG
jgi:hypothetical protein